MKALQKNNNLYNLNILHICHLFPTFRDLYIGLNPIIKVAMQPICRQILATICHYVPSFLINTILSFSRSLTTEATYIVTSSLDYYVVMNILSMADTERITVLDIDADCKNIISLSDLNFFLYGQNDQYTPLSFFHELKEMFPQVRAELAQEKVAHAFVINDSDIVANLVFNYLSCCVLKN